MGTLNSISGRPAFRMSSAVSNSAEAKWRDDTASKSFIKTEIVNIACHPRAFITNKIHAFFFYTKVTIARHCYPRLHVTQMLEKP